MERSDEARREDSLYDRIGSLERYNRQQDEKIKELETVIKSRETTIERQGKEAARRHEFLCTIKEIADNYFGDN